LNSLRNVRHVFVSGNDSKGRGAPCGQTYGQNTVIDRRHHVA